MAEFITMDEVPAWVWNAVYKKWEAALETGWQSELWTKCTLCNWLNIEGHGCVSCPLNPCWCRAFPSLSRIHIYHESDREETWEEAVEAFLKYIKPHCEYEPYKHDFNWY